MLKLGGSSELPEAPTIKNRQEAGEGARPRKQGKIKCGKTGASAERFCQNKERILAGWRLLGTVEGQTRRKE